ncbi:hypothetical protein COLO4_13487 [Corchorus olitorius]|uniref:Uncharacterized protein n=1 Tax=Corchorus olitorius TaxID=93759 RepID=A0A1R3JWU2_9ROSI|nr:hypothetical protein COLO4_13487 [Corchorus olitorius]
MVKFNIFDAMRFPSDVHAVFSIDILDSLSERVMMLDEDKVETVMFNGFDDKSYGELELAPCEKPPSSAKPEPPPPPYRSGAAPLFFPLSKPNTSIATTTLFSRLHLLLNPAPHPIPNLRSLLLLPQSLSLPSSTTTEPPPNPFSLRRCNQHPPIKIRR